MTQNLELWNSLKVQKVDYTKIIKEIYIKSYKIQFINSVIQQPHLSHSFTASGLNERNLAKQPQILKPESIKE